MSEKKAGQSEAEGGINFRTLEPEAGQEMDSMFAPSVKEAGGTGEGSRSGEGGNNFSESGPKPEPEASLDATSDLDVLQFEIDREIDSLFAPSAEPDLNEGPVRIENEGPQLTMPGPPKEGDPSSAPSGTMGCEELQAGKTIETHQLPELDQRIEILNAAFLSLDWEFSHPNIGKFLAALNQLEPFASKSADARSAFRILQIILKRLLDRPFAVNGKLIQLIRDSQGLLTHMLLMQDETGANEKRRLKDIIELFQELRRRALQVKAANSSRGGETVQAPAACFKPEPFQQVHAPGILSVTGKGPFLELPDSIDKFCGALSENLDIIYAEIGRLRQIAAQLGETPALVAFAQSLGEIGSTLENRIDIVREKSGKLTDKVSRLQESQIARFPNVMNTEKEEDGRRLIQTASERKKASTHARREIVCLTASDGQHLRLPASYVLRVADYSGKKGLRILERGYATLVDFRPAFRGIKSLLLGEWAGLPGRILKSYRFELVMSNSFKRLGADGGVAVLASDGFNRAIMFAERVDFKADAEVSPVPLLKNI